MNPTEIASLEGRLADFLDPFADCFGRSEPRENLAVYVRGQLSQLERKSVEPIALAAGVRPRTLQCFLSRAHWDHDLLRDRTQRIVARDFGSPDAVLVVDETSFVKKGDKTPGVQRQHCGAVGKLENCVVTVHAAYFVPQSGFRTLLDSGLYLPEASWADPKRREEAGVPLDLAFRTKPEIALEQIRRARANGVPFGWVTADEGYGRQRSFVTELDDDRQPFVVEVPRNFLGWFIKPATTRGDGPKRIDRLCRGSDRMNRQAWTPIRVKGSEKGEVVWEAKSQRFWFPHEDRVRGPFVAILARNVLDPKEKKYFVASDTAPLEKLLHVAFCRFGVERCFEDAKSELGFGHFEVRTHQSLLRHCYVTQLSHLFLAAETDRLRGEKPGDHRLPGSAGGRRGGARPRAAAAGTASPVR